MHYAQAKTILSAKNGMNIYRGCTHGCIYCDSRSVCYGFTHEFTDVEVKQNAPELLAEALRKKRKKVMVGMGSMCDPYMPLEEKLLFTRRCAETVLKYGHGLTLITKSDRVLRDIDLFTEINRKAKCIIQMTLTTFDDATTLIVEPNAPKTVKRYEALKELQKNNIPTVVWITPILPYINDTAENLTGILNYCRDAGVSGIIWFGAGLTLREGDREYYFAALDRFYPGLKERYLKQYGFNYVLTSPNNAELDNYFHAYCEKYSIMHDTGRIFSYLSTFPAEKEETQLSLL